MHSNIVRQRMQDALSQHPYNQACHYAVLSTHAVPSLTEYVRTELS